MELHMREFDGTTFGMDVQNSLAFRNLKKHVFYGEVKPAGRHLSVKRLCIPAKYVAAVMGPAAWLVTEERCMETVRWKNSAEHYIIYDSEEQK